MGEIIFSGTIVLTWYLAWLCVVLKFRKAVQDEYLKMHNKIWEMPISKAFLITFYIAFIPMMFLLNPKKKMTNHTQKTFRTKMHWMHKKNHGRGSRGEIEFSEIQQQRINTEINLMIEKQNYKRFKRLWTVLIIFAITLLAISIMIEFC